MLCVVLTGGETRAEDQRLTTWSTWNIQYLYGFNYDLGEDARDTMTFEHADQWKYGDNFFFLDVNTLVERDRETADTALYGEWHPRLSVSKLSGKDLSVGPIRDVLTAHELDFGEDSLVYLSGVGLSLNLPGFEFANLNALFRDDVDQDGSTWQISVEWNAPIELFGWHWSYGGYIDFAGEEGNLAWNINSDTQLLLDVGERLGYKNQLWAGIELLLRHNEFGIDGQDEFVPQMMVKWVF